MLLRRRPLDSGLARRGAIFDCEEEGKTTLEGVWGIGSLVKGTLSRLGWNLIRELLRNQQASQLVR